jgi:hypothetical protein
MVIMVKVVSTIDRVTAGVILLDIGHIRHLERYKVKEK